MADPWADFNAPVPNAPAPTRRARVTRENPRSQVATDPYVNLEQDLEPYFMAPDRTSVIFGPPEQYQIHEITHSVAKGQLLGYGYRVLRNGTLAARMSGDAIPLEWDDIPAYLHERLQP
jgi:hypothetical protein